MAHLSFNEIMQNYVNASYSLLLVIARDSLETLKPTLNKIAPDDCGASLILPFICLTVSADGRFSKLEFDFINDLININTTYDEFKAFVESFYTDEWTQMIHEMVDSFSRDDKGALLNLAASISAVDGTITRSETAFIAKLIE